MMTAAPHSAANLWHRPLAVVALQEQIHSPADIHDRARLLVDDNMSVAGRADSRQVADLVVGLARRAIANEET